jgi:hypothetical protein
MKDEKPARKDDDDEDILDKHDDAVIAADDTGMLAGERMITLAEIAEAESNDSSKR